MTLLYSDPRFLDHDTGTHPESATRLVEVNRHLSTLGIASRCQQPGWSPAGPAQLGPVHTTGLIESLQRVAGRGGGRMDPDTVVSAASYEVALLAAGAAIDAARQVLEGPEQRAICLVRPPGHHALAERAMGFCLLNNVALAARYAVDHFSLERVLIVDWDVHHGNGTQDIFYDDPRVGYLSIHRWPFYPGTGAADETGRGDGLGTTRNLPVEFGTSPGVYHDLFRNELERLADRLRPQLVLVSAGFDSHRDDPIGSLGLDVEDFSELTAAVLEVAGAHAGGRVVSLLEGGYHPARLAESVAVHLEGLLAADPGA